MEEGLRFNDRMSDLEALLWDLDDDQPARRPIITIVVMFDRGPDPAALAERVERLSRRLPRFRARVAPSRLPTAPPRWESDPDFDLSRHLRTVVASQPISLEYLLRLAEPVASDLLDRGRPPWQICLVGDLHGGGALIVQLHHTFTDGLGAMKVASELFDLERQPPPRVAEPAPADPRPWPDQGRPSPHEGVWEDLAYEAERSVDVARRLIPWATSGIRDAVVDPERRCRSTLELLQSWRGLAGAASRPGSPILAGRSTGTRFAALEFPLSELRSAARRAGGTINDVFLAAVVGGLRLYHAKRGHVPPGLRIGIPVSTRAAGGVTEVRNQFAPILVRAPLQLHDPVERIRLLHDLVAAARHQPALDLLEHATGILRRTPGARRFIRALVASADLMASNVPGSPVDLFLGGARVERLVPLGPRGGSGLNLTLVSHVDRVHIGLNADPVTIPDLGVLVDCVRSGFDETLG
jgi:diacylglycerol O-acyltransferase